MAASRPSFPAPSEPNLRRLGVGSAQSAERPLRAQLVVALVFVLLVVAVPVYFLRRPSPTGSAKDSDGPKVATRGLIRSSVDAGAPTLRVKLGAPQRVKCSAAPNRDGNEGNLCDRLPAFEAALRTAIEKTIDCAPQTGKDGTINFVLTADFTKKRLNVFAGASGQWRGPQAKAAAKCVLRSLPAPDWDTIVHRYRYYALSILASYPAPDPLEGLPNFE